MDADQLIAKVDRLVSLPNVYYRLETLIESPDSTVDDFAQVLSADPDLCARLLNAANSAFYNFPSPIDSVHKAVSIIGTRQIRELVLATTVMKRFDNISMEGIDMNSFWQHSIAVAVMSKHIALELRQPKADKAYVPGLLHDIGHLVLFLHYAEEMNQLLAKYHLETVSLTELEENLVEFNHADIGGKLLRKWNLPESIIEPVLCHHHPEKSFEFHNATCLLHVADCVVIKYKFGDSGEINLQEVNQAVLNELNLTIEKLDEIWLSAKQEIDEVCRQFLNH